MKKKLVYYILFTLLWILGAFVAIFVLFGKEILPDNDFINAILVGDLGTWGGIAHWFSASVTQIILSFVWVIAFMTFYQVIKVFLKKSFYKTNEQKTSTKMMISFLKYATLVIIVFVLLGTWGVDGTALFASAGVIGLIVAFGAQSLIADIVSGLFIVFEKEFKVGDIVTIDDFRGTVQEIGVRTTKIKDGVGNVKIINNSDIRSVLNMSMDLSVTVVDFDIEYGTNLYDVEKVIAANLVKIKDQIPEMIENPQYLGIGNLGPNGMTLKFLAKSKENDRFTVERALRRGLKLMFDAHQIHVPVMQVKIHQEASSSQNRKDSSKNNNP